MSPFRAITLSVLIVLVCAGPAASAGEGSPRLTLAHADPFTVHGTAFRPHERVRVVVRAPGGPQRDRRVRAGAHGGFKAVFDDLRWGRCRGVSVTATGSRGSRATLRRPPLPACMPARPPIQRAA
jgi:hypothetical protein